MGFTLCREGNMVQASVLHLRGCVPGDARLHEADAEVGEGVAAGGAPRRRGLLRRQRRGEHRVRVVLLLWPRRRQRPGVPALRGMSGCKLYRWPTAGLRACSPLKDTLFR